MPNELKYEYISRVRDATVEMIDNCNAKRKRALDDLKKITGPQQPSEKNEFLNIKTSFITSFERDDLYSRWVTHGARLQSLSNMIQEHKERELKRDAGKMCGSLEGFHSISFSLCYDAAKLQYMRALAGYSEKMYAYHREYAEVQQHNIVAHRGRCPTNIRNSPDLPSPIHCTDFNREFIKLTGLSLEGDTSAW